MYPWLAYTLLLFNQGGSDHSCSNQRTQVYELDAGGKGNSVYLVEFNNQPCSESFEYNNNHPFCENSGWGDEEASVVCRSERISTYGIGGTYI